MSFVVSAQSSSLASDANVQKAVTNKSKTSDRFLKKFEIAVNIATTLGDTRVAPRRSRVALAIIPMDDAEFRCRGSAAGKAGLRQLDSRSIRCAGCRPKSNRRAIRMTRPADSRD